jgi:hypothetical protein
VRVRWSRCRSRRAERSALEPVRVLAEHFANVGGRLDGAVDAYNKGGGSLESGVLVNVRKLKEMGAGTETQYEEVKPVEKVARAISCWTLTVLSRAGTWEAKSSRGYQADEIVGQHFSRFYCNEDVECGNVTANYFGIILFTETDLPPALLPDRVALTGNQ